RNARYSMAWMLRMPRAAAPNVVDVSVLVFSGRSLDALGFTPQEKYYQAVFNAQANTIAVYGSAATYGTPEPPSLRRGQWILDASSGVNPNNNTLSPRGFFYRIVSVSDPIPDAAFNSSYVNVEVQTPLRGWITGDLAFPIYPPQAGFPAGPPNGPTAPGQLGAVVIFDNLVEVFDEGTF